VPPPHGTPGDVFVFVAFIFIARNKQHNNSDNADGRNTHREAHP
jgi:hypothetical protein